MAALSGVQLLLALVAVVRGWPKALSPGIEALVDAAIVAQGRGRHRAIALLVLMPETWAAVRAARANRLQTSMNLALGSGAGEHRPHGAGGGAGLGVAGPASGAGPAAQGDGDARDDLLVSAITLGSGRTHLMQGAVHLVVFAAFLFLAFVP